jgi:hypothetical protein
MDEDRVMYEEQEPPGPLVWLQGWYASQCNGDWEHGYGIEIRTLDNPGWTLTVHLDGTGLEGATFERREIMRGEHDWVHAWVADDKFEAACGPLNLGEALHLLRELAQGAG